MGITKAILRWTEELFDDAVYEDNSLKAFLSGAVEGLVDNAVVWYIPLLIACCVYSANAEANKEN